MGASNENAEKKKLQNSLEQIRSVNDSNSPGGWRLYNIGMMEQAMGNTEQAERAFREAFPLMSLRLLCQMHCACDRASGLRIGAHVLPPLMGSRVSSLIAIIKFQWFETTSGL